MNNRYIIAAIDPQNGKHNFYHDEMRGSIATIVSAEVGDGAIISISLNMMTVTTMSPPPQSSLPRRRTVYLLSKRATPSIPSRPSRKLSLFPFGMADLP